MLRCLKQGPERMLAKDKTISDETYLVLCQCLDLSILSGLRAQNAGKTDFAGVTFQSTENQSIGHSLNGTRVTIQRTRPNGSTYVDIIVGLGIGEGLIGDNLLQAVQIL